MIVLEAPPLVSVAISVKLVKPLKFAEAVTLRMLLLFMVIVRFLVFAAVKVMLLASVSSSCT